MEVAQFFALHLNLKYLCSEQSLMLRSHERSVGKNQIISSLVEKKKISHNIQSSAARSCEKRRRIGASVRASRKRKGYGVDTFACGGRRRTLAVPQWKAANYGGHCDHAKLLTSVSALIN